MTERLLGEPLPLKTEGKPINENGQIGMFDSEINETGASVKFEKGEVDDSEEDVKVNYNTIANVNHTYILCDTKEKREELIKTFGGKRIFL